MTHLFEELTFKRGPAIKNRFMLAPLTNQQSHHDGTLSDDEFKWLTMRAKGGFGQTMTCAAHVQKAGQGFAGQLAAFDDKHLEGLKRLADEIRRQGSISSCQLYHGGYRCPSDVTGLQPTGPSDNEESGSRGMTRDELKGVISNFIEAAVRCEQAGFDGVELHGAHSYLICQFLSPDYNQREDEYGGSAENRARFLKEIIGGIREKCGADFQVGVRLSPERMGVYMQDMLDLARGLMAEGDIDYLDMSLWDCFKEPEEDAFKGRALIEWFAELPRNGVRLVVAGNIRTPQDADRVLATGVDALMLGRVAILHHNYPALLQADPKFQPIELPVPRDHLRAEGVSESFIDYLQGMGRFGITST
ncbi:MAG: NADH:flavin oxidoreductase [Pseudomonadales bacterium]|nr:NADH:flavin oxidoreductase [Pseudomonadales bacterium]MBO6565377.1 NADH:flavin oxidoreductase [Pseudomonadales bacterium]MBO6594685.1 NADH:flavin oxidoreductase [Pseudomonadales bacterium]MBO6655387.1 NADH:flavin oxidoreductase [Pseudomonadales bacterium]MBO6701190.1 NADH:flavin oxidoreductase [Pseudomonadales bacterium]